MPTIRRLLELSAPEYRLQWATVFGLMLTVALAETIFTAVFFIFVAMLAGQHGAIPGPASVLLGTDAPSVTTVALILGLIVLARAAVGLALAYAQSRTAALDGAHLARKLLERYLNAPFGDMRERETSVLIRNINNSVEAVFNGVAVPIAMIVAEVLVSAGIVAVLALAAPAATAGAALLAATLSLVVIKVMQPVQFRLGMRSQDLSARQFGELAQVFTGLREAKVFRAEAYFARRFGELREQISRNLTRIGFLAGMPRIVVESVFVLATVATAAALMATRSMDAELLALFGLFAYAGLRIMPSAARIISCFNSIRLAEPALIEVATDFARLPARDEAKARTAGAAEWREIRMERVGFTYPGRSEPAIRDVSFVLRRGQAIGITGRSGSGKSTLVDLITGLLQPDSGTITTESGAHLHGEGAVLEGLGYVPQQPILLNASVRENIAFGVPAREIDDALVAKVAKLTQLHDFIMSLREGYRSGLAARALFRAGRDHTRRRSATRSL